jgi:excisionase family DNA binding protein
MLTTQEAADLLNISRPTLVKLLEEGRIPYDQPGRHRKVSLDAALQYQQQTRARRRAALDELTRDSVNEVKAILKAQ